MNAIWSKFELNSTKFKFCEFSGKLIGQSKGSRCFWLGRCGRSINRILWLVFRLKRRYFYGGFWFLIEYYRIIYQMKQKNSVNQSYFGQIAKPGVYCACAVGLRRPSDRPKSSFQFQVPKGKDVARSLQGLPSPPYLISIYFYKVSLIVYPSYLHLLTSYYFR